MLNFNSLLIFSENPAILVEFYKKIFRKAPEWNGGNFSGFQVGDGFITIGPHSQVHGKNGNPERIMFNLETDDVEGEFQRIKNFGTKVVAKPYHPAEDKSMLLATFSDPDGNYFQLNSPMGKAQSNN